MVRRIKSKDLSIPLNGFVAEANRVRLRLRGAFNSIEWIQESTRYTVALITDTSLSIPLNGFAGLEEEARIKARFIFQFH